MRRAASIATCGVLVLLLAGCEGVIGGGGGVDNADVRMLGLGASELRRCAGIPDAERTTENGRRLVYFASTDLADRREITRIVATPPTRQRTAEMGEPRFCTAVVTLGGGTIDAVSFGGPTGGLTSRGAQCRPIFAHCLERLSQQARLPGTNGG